MTAKWKQNSGTRWIRVCFIALLIVCLTALLSFAKTHVVSSGQIEELRKIRGSFTFAVIGDTRSGGKVYLELAQRLMEHQPSFVVNTGDVVFKGDKTLWDEFWQLSKPITVPYFLTAGNHDVDDKESEDLFKEQVDPPGNKPYYSFSAGDSIFIILDSNMPGRDRRITGEQYEWLEQTLSTSRHKYKFAFVHHPLYPEMGLFSYFGGSLDKYPKERDRLEALFEKYNLTIIFAGHEHLYHRKMVNGVMHVTTGGGGAMLYAKEKKGGFNHFISVTVNEDGVKGEVIDIKGRVRDTFQIE